MRVLVAGVLAVVCLAGCLKPSSSRCGDLYCPAGTTCAPDQSRCISPAQSSACDGKQENDPCSLAGAPAAFCIGSVCTAQVCGDAIVEGDEICDKGTQNGKCMGCSADCKSDESCGNHIIDAECMEECDDGAMNADAPNAPCRTTCKRQRCGDGIVDDKSGEDCDGTPNPQASCSSYGFYTGTIRCSTACRNDTTMCSGFCGDGIVNGPELCDGAPPGGQSCLDFGYDVGAIGCSKICVPSFARCERLGWQNAGIPFSAYFDGIWGAAADDVWATGINGMAAHFDGTKWTPASTPSSEEFYQVTGSASNNVIAVGTHGAIMRWDGSAWSLQASGVMTLLQSVWVLDATHAFAVGVSGVILRWDGTAWSSMTSGTVEDLYGVWASSPTNAWASGTNRTLLHWDGIKWTPVTIAALPATNTLFAAWGSSASDVWIASNGGMLARYNGVGWSTVSTGVTNSLFSFWGDSSKDVWIGGDNGVTVHWDGATFSTITSSASNQISNLWGAGADDVFAVAGPIILRFRGGPTWAKVDAATAQALYGVWGSGPSDVHVVGANGTSRHFDGSSWSTLALPNNFPAGNGLWWVWGSGPSDVYATADSGWLLHYAGGKWTQIPTGSTALLSSVWGSGAQDVWVTGDAGTLLHYDGVKWKTLDTTKVLPAPMMGSPQPMIYQAWGTAADDAWFAGGNATVLHWDGTMLTPYMTGGSSDVWGVYGYSRNDVYALADVDDAYHWDGASWQKMTFRSPDSLDYASGPDPTELFAIDYYATSFYEYDGVDWAPIRTPAGASVLYNLWTTPTVGYVVGGNGQVLRLDRHCAPTEYDCKNRWDDDCDGLLNCADSDCSGDAYCKGGGICSDAPPIACGASLHASTAAGEPLLERYGCSSRLEPSNEMIYRFTSSSTVTATVQLAGDAMLDLDLIVLGADANGACEPLATCLAASATPSSTEMVGFTAQAGATYFFVVDGASGAGGFTLQVGCQ